MDSRASTRLRRAGNFSLCAQRKVTKRKHTPARRPPGILPSGSAGSVRVPLTARPCADSGMSAIHRAPPSGFSSPDPPPSRGPNSSALLRAKARAKARRVFCFCGRVPPQRGPCGAARLRRTSPQGGAHDARQFDVGTWMCCRRTPEQPREVGRQDAWRPHRRGVLSLGYLSLHKQRKVTRSTEGLAKALVNQQSRTAAHESC